LLGGCQQGRTPTQKEEAAREWNGARSSVLTSLANEQYKSGNFDKCRRTVDEALKMTPDSEPLHVLSAKLAIENGQLEVAEQELALARKYNPNDPEPFYLSGVVCQRWQKPQLAYDYYHQASGKAPAELAYVLAESEMLVALDHAAEALTLLQGKVVYFEHSGAIRDVVGQLLMQAGRYPEAVVSFREASILAEDDQGIRERLASALFHVNEYREAAEILARLTQLEAFAKRADLFTMLGECQLGLGKSREARYSFETASGLDQYNAHIWQCLGRAALETGDFRRAELALGRSVKLDGSVADAHLLLGYTHLRQNKLSEALAEFQKASAIEPRDTVTLCMVGYALQKMGRSDEAFQTYAKALKIKPGDDMARTLMADVDGK
jgi:Flp pilus assembly protein TadD